MENLDTHECLSYSKSLEATPCTFTFFPILKKINLFLVAFQCIVTNNIHYDVMEHQNNLHDTSRIIITYILLFQWINNRLIF